MMEKASSRPGAVLCRRAVGHFINPTVDAPYMKENPEDDEDDAGAFALLDALPPRKSKLLPVAGAAENERTNDAGVSD